MRNLHYIKKEISNSMTPTHMQCCKLSHWLMRSAHLISYKKYKDQTLKPARFLQTMLINMLI